MSNTEKRGFMVHFSFVEQLKVLSSKMRAEVLNDAFSVAFGLKRAKVSDKTGVLLALSHGISSENERFCSQIERRRDEMREKTRLRVAKFRQTNGNALPMNGESLPTVGNGERKNERTNERRVTQALHSRPMPDDILRIVAHNIGADETWALDVFAPEMDRLNWQARNNRGGMYGVTAANLASVMRGWWRVENQGAKNPLEKNSAPRVIDATGSADLARCD